MNKFDRPFESDWFQTFLGIALISAVGIILVISVTDEFKEAAAQASNAANRLTGDANDSTVITATSAQQTAATQANAAPLSSEDEFFWPGQNVEGATFETVSGWLGATAPGLEYSAPPLAVEANPGGPPLTFQAQVGYGLATSAVNL